MFHINGPSGSGKTTLGNRLAKLPNVLVIDTDDIDDPNSMRVISKFPFEDSKDERAINMEIGKMNKTAIDKIVKENKGKTIIFVGFFHNGMRYLEKKIEHGYAIDIDAVTLWKHYNLRLVEIMPR